MKHIKSTLNLQTPRLQHGIKSLSLFPNEFHERKHYYSPPSHTQLLSVPSKENIQKNPSFPIKHDENMKKTEGKKDKKEINIRLKIQSEIIQNNYLQNQFKNKKYSSSSSMLSNEEMLQHKERQIAKLKKELANTKHQISYLLNEKNLKHTIEKIDSSESNLSDRIIKMSIWNKKKTKEHSPFKSSALMTKNVRQFFRNNIKNTKTSSTKQLNHLNYLISPKHCYSSAEGFGGGDKDDEANTNYSSNNNNSLKKTLDDLQKRASNVFNMYLNMYNS